MVKHVSPVPAKASGDENSAPQDAPAAPRERAAPSRRPPLVAIQATGLPVNRKQLLTHKPATLARTKPAANLSPAIRAEVPKFALREDASCWEDKTVQVFVRVRPLSSSEEKKHGYKRCLKQTSAENLTWIGPPETQFAFGHVACEATDQKETFRVAGLPLVEKCLAGHNTSIFSYGQTGSGKTYTMIGEINDLKVNPSEKRGLIPRIFEYLYARIREEEVRSRGENLKYSCKCSFLEIYNEQITDLLDPKLKNLQIREDTTKAVYVENLTECEVSCLSDVVNLLLKGSENRKVAATNLNPESSRSHIVFTCIVERVREKDSAQSIRSSRLNLIDLSGSERQRASGAEGERLKEATNINKSLSTLSLVIMNLIDLAHGKIRHIPYRDSKLTFLLQDSLGGNSKTLIIVNVSPSVGETLSTLKFANRARLVQNKAFVNEETSLMEKDSGNLENELALHIELELYKAFLGEQISARAKVEQLLKKRDLQISELNARCEQDQTSHSSEIKLLERTISDLETTLCSFEDKVKILNEVVIHQRAREKELEEELKKVRVREDGMVDLTCSSRQPSKANPAERANCDNKEPAGQRRKARRWAPSEEAALTNGVKMFGVGNWNCILRNDPNGFCDRTAVDLKDKWRNMTNKEDTCS